jgi:hypothetical protein
MPCLRHSEPRIGMGWCLVAGEFFQAVCSTQEAGNVYPEARGGRGPDYRSNQVRPITGSWILIAKETCRVSVDLPSRGTRLTTSGAIGAARSEISFITVDVDGGTIGSDHMYLVVGVHRQHGKRQGNK